MRKLFLLSVACIAVMAHARQISETEAASIASEFLGSTIEQHEPVRKGVHRAAGSYSGNSDSAPFYVFNANDGQGFVIISGDDRAQCVLGYSDYGKFDYADVPPQLVYMMDLFSERIKKMPADAPAHSSWRSPRVGVPGNESILLETACWGQGAPYNSLCPVIDGVQAPAGCVATAMAIIMKYHNWPGRGEGFHSYVCNGQNLSFDYGIDFDWTNTPSRLTGDSSDEEIDNVAKLMSACGIAVDMGYSQKESGAFSAPVSIAMSDYFVYSPLSQLISNKNYTQDDWANILKYELSLNRPLIYFVGGASGNHAVVCDGYNQSYFHINWGWDGNYNGYFALNDLNPYGQADSEAGYNDYAEALIGIVPNKTQHKIGVSPLCIYPIGVTSTSSELHAGNEFELLVNNLFSIQSGFKGEVAAVLADQNGNIKEVLSTQELTLEREANSKMVFPGCKLSSVEKGDIVTVVSREAGSNDWQFIIRQPWCICNTAIYPQIYRAQKCNLELKLDAGVKVELFIGETEDDMDLNHPVAAGEFPYGTNLRAKVSFEDPSKLHAVQVSHCDFGYVYRYLDAGNWLPLEQLCQPVYTVEVRLYDKSELIDKHVHVENAGMLSYMLSEEDFKIGSLSLSGKIGSLDMVEIKDRLPLLYSLDMGQCSYSDDAGSGLQGLDNRRFLERVILPADLKSIGQSAFLCSAVKEVSFPSGLESIGDQAFSRCKYLTGISLPSNLKMMGRLCFDKCEGLTEITIPSGVSRIPDNAFDGCVNLSSVTIEGDVSEIGNYAFNECVGLRHANLGNSLIAIGDYAFRECTSLSDIQFAASLVNIGQSAFYNDCSLKRIEIPHSVESIGKYAFYNCTSAKQLSLSNQLVEIEDGTFMSCNGYSDLRLGDKIRKIGQSALSGNYTDLYLNAALENVASFGLNSNSCVNVYTPSIQGFAVEDDAIRCQNLYIPGKTLAVFDHIADAKKKEMWSYSLHKDLGAVTLRPAIAGVVIDRVVINGDVVYLDGDNLYRYTPADDLDITVEYTLNGSQSMLTHYTPEFNAGLADEPISSVVSTVALADVRINAKDNCIQIATASDNANVVVFDSMGSCLYRGNEHTVSGLCAGLYLVVVDGRTFKVTI